MPERRRMSTKWSMSTSKMNELRFKESPRYTACSFGPRISKGSTNFDRCGTPHRTIAKCGEFDFELGCGDTLKAAWTHNIILTAQPLDGTRYGDRCILVRPQALVRSCGRLSLITWQRTAENEIFQIL